MKLKNKSIEISQDARLKKSEGWPLKTQLSLLLQESNGNPQPVLNVIEEEIAKREEAKQEREQAVARLEKLFAEEVGLDEIVGWYVEPDGSIIIEAPNNKFYKINQKEGPKND